MIKKIIPLVSLALLASFNSFGGDVPEFRGKGRTGVYDETGLLKSWGESPKLLWKLDKAGEGFLAPSVVGDTLYLCALDAKKKNEVFRVLDKSGNLLWELNFSPTLTKGNYKCSRVMPTIVDNFAYMISATGEVVCIDLSAKKISWKVNVSKEYGAKTMNWGFAENLLVGEGKVIVTTGGDSTSVIALNAKSGALEWKTPSFDESASYTSPILIEHNGKKQVAAVLFGRALGVDIDNGEVLWTTELKRQGVNTQRKKPSPKNDFWDVTGASPLYKDGKLFLTSGYNAGSLMLALPDGKGEVSVVWKNPDLDNHHGGTVLLDGRIYGANWETNQMGNWMCVDWESGKTIYNEEWKGCSKGSIVSADGLLYLYEEKKGLVGLVKPADNFELISSFQIKEGRGSHWAHIVIADKVMYVKRGEVLFAYDIKE